MARQEQDREDLIGEATALVERVEFTFGSEDPVIVGFRNIGCGSVFFGGEPVYQFNTQKELRRAYFEGRLYKAQARRLISLDRQRTAEGVHLLRLDLNAAETDRFLGTMQNRLRQLAEAISSGECRVTRQVPEDVKIVSRISTWLGEVAAQPMLAESPHAR